MLPGVVVAAAQPRMTMPMVPAVAQPDRVDATTASDERATLREPSQADQLAVPAELLPPMPMGPVPEVTTAVPMGLLGPAPFPPPLGLDPVIRDRATQGTDEQR
jgi:hypothetical protein